MSQKITSREIFVNEIVFHRTDVIHLYGFIFSGGDYLRTRFVCSLTLLSSLLSQNGKTGRELVEHMRQLLNEPHASPLSIDVIDRFGTTLPLEAYAIQMQMPLEENHHGESVAHPTELVFIERVIPFPAA